MVSVTTSIMIAAGKPAWTLHTAWPLLLAALAGHLVFIPVAGSVGAAAVTTALALAAAIVTVFLVHRLWGIGLGARTLRRGGVVCALVYMIASLPVTTGLSLVLKLAGAGLFVLIALLPGEFSRREISVLRAMLRHRVHSIIETSGKAS
jgi:O-antigen/teichoic acid export membrane protein